MFNAKRPLAVNKTPAVPPIDEINPALAEALKKKVELGVERAALQAEDFDLARSTEHESADTASTARVAAILGLRAPPVVPHRYSRRQEIVTRLRDLNDALDVLDRTVYSETSRAAAVLQERMRPEYARRVRALTDSLIAVDAALRSCWELSDAVSDAGYSSGWMSAHFTRLLEPGRNGTVGLLLHDIADSGYLNKSDIPKELA